MELDRSPMTLARPRSRLASLRNAWRSLPRSSHVRFARLALRASRTWFAATLLATLLAATTPLATPMVTGALIGEVSAWQASAATPGSTALWWAAAIGACLLLQWLAASLLRVAAAALGERVDTMLQRGLMKAVMTSDGIEHLEDPATIDLISVGRETFRSSWGRPGQLAATLSGMVAGRAMMIGASLILARFQMPLAVALLAAALWTAREEKVASRQEAAHHYGSTELSRRMDYLHELGSTPPASKEVRVFGLSGLLLDRFTSTWRRSMDGVLTSLPVRPLLATTALATVVIGGLAWIVSAAVAGRLSPEAAAVQAQALMVCLAGMRLSSWTGLQTELATATLRRYERAAEAAAAARPAARSDGRLPARTGPDDLPREAIRFEGVSFSYPGGGEALRHLDLTVPAGRSLAVVGANGAGKTTLIKLLCRMYRPSDGRILVDGMDLASFDPAAWRRRLAAVFQDSMRFPLTARANIAFGRPHLASDQAGIEAAAVSAGIADDVAGLPHGWDTPLSSEYAGGSDMSGGQWQKIALARALFAVHHGAGVLILDEPAAHLDARSEARLHDEFLALTEGLTTVIISHRFSTVRRASSIAVLDEGRVVEQGSHDELMALDGAYARMFLLQSARFADAGAPEVRSG
ncbi:ABC transporter ATP-binding protein [Nonomuraea purpurea]|uniref:ABC transporter ATP-binding protein n=1 Tax=Nonomuraea purpurea TaxID=1849276 RepID=A0ABV8GPJ3_9ACTN